MKNYMSWKRRTRGRGQEKYKRSRKGRSLTCLCTERNEELQELEEKKNQRKRTAKVQEEKKRQKPHLSPPQ
jgi:hypothetical protein